MKNMYYYAMFDCAMLKLLDMESYWAVNLNKLEAALEEEEEGTPEVEDISLDTLLTIIWIVLNITLGAF